MNMQVTKKGNEEMKSLEIEQDAYNALSSLPSRVKQSSPFVLTFAEMQRKQETSVVRMR